MFPIGVTHHLKVFLNKKDPKMVKVQWVSFLLHLPVINTGMQPQELRRKQKHCGRMW